MTSLENSSPTTANETALSPIQQGALMGIAAYVLWGMFPLYWKALRSVPAMEVLCHRIVWSFIFLTMLMRRGGSLAALWNTVRATPQVSRYFLMSSLLIGINWYLFIWAVNAGSVLEVSLGYFLNPLVSVFLGIVFLRERLRVGQWLAIGIMVCAVGWQAVTLGRLPLIALSLTITFGSYGLVRKIAPLPAKEGLYLETVFLLLPALLFLGMRGGGAILHTSPLVFWLLVGTGIVTSIPLLLFAGAARRLPLTTLGVLQYIAPTLQFLTAVFIYHEPLSNAVRLTFICIWTALVLYAIEGIIFSRKSSAQR
jgi:chloramphenicol-sensitive protein RarD